MTFVVLVFFGFLSCLVTCRPPHTDNLGAMVSKMMCNYVVIACIHLECITT